MLPYSMATQLSFRSFVDQIFTDSPAHTCLDTGIAMVKKKKKSGEVCSHIVLTFSHRRQKQQHANWGINKVILETHMCSEETLNRLMRDGAS